MPTTDEEGIRRTLVLQAQLRDDGNVDEWPTNFTPDGVFISPAGRFEGRAAIATHLNGLYESGGKIGRHFVGSSVIDVDGDSATSTTDFTFIAPAGDGTFRLLASGRYYDELIHDADGRWRFTTRRVDLVGGAPSPGPDVTVDTEAPVFNQNG
jgi:ketosteroid isomerase-like protein